MIDHCLQLLPNKTNYIVDIGASTGGGPLYPFLQNTDYSGIAIECVESNYIKLCEKLNNPKIHKHHGFATPDNICSIFSQYNAPINFDLLKIDIDGYDLSVIRSILQSYRPSIIIAEINEKIPPPIHFEINYSKDYFWDGSHCYGFSIQAGKDIIEPFGYKMSMIYDCNNIICLNTTIFNVPDIDIQQIYRKGYSDNNHALHSLPWNQDVHYWTRLTSTPELLKSEIFTYFTQYNPRGRKIPPEIFTLRISDK